MKFKFIILFALLVSLNSAVKAKTPSPDSNEKIEVTPSPMDNACPADSKLPKITLVLGGGGCKALAEIGVLKVFERNHIPIHYIVGTSAGAIIGALYAAEVPLADIEELAIDGKLQGAMNPNLTFRVITLPLVKLIHFGKIYAGLTNGSDLEKFLRKKLPSEFANLKIPFAAIATDLESGNTCMITNGDLCKAIVASSAVPVLVRPVTIDNTIFIDGGIKANLPTNCAQLTGADLIVAVPADTPIRKVNKREFRSLRGLTARITDIMEVEIDKHRWQEANLVIYPSIGDTPAITKDPQIIKDTISAGEAAATEALPRLKTLIKSKTSSSSAK